MPRDKPFAERNMAVLKNCADRASELLFALAARIKSGADFALFIWLDFPNPAGVGAFAMRANNSMRPPDCFQIGAGSIIG